MRTVIENNFLRAEFESFGAELKSLKSLKSGRDYMWSADPKYWGKTSPVLFPVIGCVKEDKITVDGQDYPMSKHGFARDSEFDLVEQSETSLRYRLSTSEETFKSFPFEFQFDIVYTIEAKSLRVDYEVTNPSLEKELIYSVGAHPAFNCQWQEGDGISDYYLEFSQEENAQKLTMELPFFDGKKIDCLNGKKLQLTDNLFDDDALVFDDLKSKYLDLKRKDHEGEYLRFDFGEFPLLGIWGPPGAPFVCIEPWVGLADYVDHDGDFTHKEGVVNLEMNEKSSVSYIISILG